jgi:hypothetical protein
MSIWQADNIMNRTVWNRDLNKFVKYPGICIETPIQNGSYVGGKLWQYMHHSSESIIFLRIIKYIRKHINRISIIGVDNDKLDRDFNMYKLIMNQYNPNCINFFWAHNGHVSDTKLSNINLSYIKNKNHKWFCGYYLKKKLQDKYCMILSTAYSGINRFNGYCSGNNCIKRTYQLQYFYKPFIFTMFKKIINKQKKYQLIKHNDVKKIYSKNITIFPSFSNSYFRGNKYGLMEYIKTNNYNYILFWNSVSKLV